MQGGCVYLANLITDIRVGILTPVSFLTVVQLLGILRDQVVEVTGVVLGVKCRV